MATGGSPIKIPCENEDLPDKQNAPDFDDDTLRAAADAYRNEGNEAFKKGDSINAIHFYTKGIKMNCNEKVLKAKLYNNRAIAHSKLGNHQDSLRDAEAAFELNPTFFKAIVRGATACVELKRFEEAITWCDKGLAIDKNDRNLSSLRLQSLREVGARADLYRIKGNEAFKKGDFIYAIHFYTEGIKMNCNEKELKVKLYNNRAIAHFKLGNHQDSLRDAEAAIELNPTFLKAIVRGATACVELKRFEEAISWCDKGLAIDKNNRTLLSLRLQSVREVRDTSMEEKDHINSDHGSPSSGDVKKVVGFSNQGDKHGKVNASLSDFMAMAYFYQDLKIAKEVVAKDGEAKKLGYKGEEGKAYCNLGTAYYRLGDSKKAIEYYNLDLKIAQEVGDKRGEGEVCYNLGYVYYDLGDFNKAIECHILHGKRAREVGNKVGEGKAHGNLGIVYLILRDFENAIKHYSLQLKIIKEVGDKNGEGHAYCLLGNAYRGLGDFIKAKELHSQGLKIAKEGKDKFTEGNANYSIGFDFESQGELRKAVEHYQASINCLNNLRRVLPKSKDEWKVNFRNRYQMAYTGLWRVLVKQGNIDEALLAAEKGRAQALTDLMESSFYVGTSRCKGGDKDLAVLENVPSDTVFQAIDEADVNLWVVSKGKQVQLRQSKLNGSVSENSGASQPFESFMLGVYTQLGVRSNVRCEDRSLDALRKIPSKVNEKTKEDNPQPPIKQNESLRTLYDIVIKPVADLVQGNELLIIPNGHLWLAPYAALKDGNCKYLCELFRIRLAPSLTSLRLIADCPDHKSSGALLVGDPCLAEVTNSKGEKVFEQLPCAKEEVEMIGKILNITPITGRQATKREVLKRLSSVSLVHFAAHGCMETGEIALTPDPHRISSVPTEKDYILTIGDVLNIQLRTKIVVLSCCHSGRGEIKAEGVVGIARAFMGAGARSVVVSLWAIDDEATLQFMKCFYQHLAEGKPASESLNLAMKSLRESDEFCDIKYWAPFLLIGDDVTLTSWQRKEEI
nr:tetratricopeptide repeat protein 28-like [Pocillopora verrucosa]